MVKVNTYGLDGKKAGTTELDDAFFGAPLNVPAMHQVVTAQLANARRGTSKTKSRSEVRGGGRKPWRQKGTGRARQGSIRAPQWTGGGIVHGPSGEQNYTKRVSKKLKRLALTSALSDRAASDDIRVVEGLSFDTPSTKRAVELLTSLKLTDRKVLLVLAGVDDVLIKSVRNLRSIHWLTVDQLNTYDVLTSDVVVFAAEALDYLGSGTRADLALRDEAAAERQEVTGQEVTGQEVTA